MSEFYRYDSGSIITKPIKDEATGYWRIDATVCRDGILCYEDRSGKVRKEFRPPEENQRLNDIFNTSVFPLPVTVEHPPRPVDSSNSSLYMVGIHGRGESRYESPDVIVPLYYYQDRAIEDIVSGRRNEISLGYFCLVVPDCDTWKGERYDGVQTNIKPNHFATTVIARAGREARLHLDSNFEELSSLYDFAYEIRLDSQDKEYDNRTNKKQYFFMEQATYTYKRDGGSEVSVTVPASILPILNDRDNTIAGLQSQLIEAKNDSQKTQEIQAKLDSATRSAERYRGAHDEVADRLRVAEQILETYSVHYDSANNQWYSDSEEDAEDEEEERYDAKNDESDEDDDDEELLSELTEVLEDMKKAPTQKKEDSFVEKESFTMDTSRVLAGGNDIAPPSMVFQAIKMFPSLETRFDSAYPKDQNELFSVVATEARKELKQMNPNYNTDSMDDRSAVEAYKYALSIRPAQREDSSSQRESGSNPAFTLDAILGGLDSYRSDGGKKHHDMMDDDKEEEMMMTPEQMMAMGYKKKRGYHNKGQE